MTRRAGHDKALGDSRWRSRLRKNLLQWFENNARELPWRSDPTPYRVWVSEIMLQQTQVATVLPYFDRFLKSFPTVAALATADESDLMKHWEGLGYYRRARSLHAAARQVVENYDSEFPLRYDDVLSLPGIGRYTAGAILSISDGQRLPILEGNTQRVFSRWIGLRQPPTEKEANALLWKFAESILPPANRRPHAGIFNQAAMELGALLCTPKQPDCPNCPVKRQCAAFAENLQDEIPGKVTKTKYEDRTEYAFVIGKTSIKDDASTKYLVRPLPEGGRWAGLWDFPRSTDEHFESPESAADWLSKELGVRVRPGSRLKSIKHAVTKYRITLHVHEAIIGKSRKKPEPPWKWLDLREIKELPMSVTGRKIEKMLSKNRQPQLPLSYPMVK